MGLAFNNTAAGWQEWYSFSDSDANSGVACVVYDNADADDQYLNVYMRNSTGIITQNYWDYTVNDDWSIGPETSANFSVPSGTPIAVCNDEQLSEYVHFQLSNGTIVRGLVWPSSRIEIDDMLTRSFQVDPSGSDFEQYDLLQPATGSSKLSSTFAEGGSLLLFQNDTSASTMWVSATSRTMVSILNQAVP